MGTSYALNRNVKFNVGAMITIFDKNEKSIKYGENIEGDILFTERYSRSSAVFAIGLDVNIDR